MAAVLRPHEGTFELVSLVRAPARSEELNDEGFARLPCRDDRALVVWADDLATGGHALRESVLPCRSFADTVGVTATSSAPITLAPNDGTPIAAAVAGDPNDDGRSATVMIVTATATATVAAGAAVLARRRRHRRVV
jgi:hypothetical protein